MKKKYIIGAVIAVTFAVVAILSFDSSKIEYTNFAKAKATEKTYQIIGSWLKDKPSNYNNKDNTFTFYMCDDKKDTACVIFHGAKPNNFDMATQVVVKGSYTQNSFHASEILTKCPSKYEAEMKKAGS